MNDAITPSDGISIAQAAEMSNLLHSRTSFARVMPLRLWLTAVLALSIVVAVPALARAQDTTDPTREIPAAVSPDHSDKTVPAATSGVQDTTLPQPAHTGLSTLFRDTVLDYATLPRRESTWWILGIGGALAASLHPLDGDGRIRPSFRARCRMSRRSGNSLGR